jgi:hypothetical protein
VISRVLAVLLAVFIGGPSCFCLAEVGSPAPSAPLRGCCKVAHRAVNEAHSSKPAPADSCHCNKCLVKRTLANDAPQIPSVAWMTAPAVIPAHGHEFPVSEWTAWSRFLMDTGPPHERQAIYSRHRALLL